MCDFLRATWSCLHLLVEIMIATKDKRLMMTPFSPTQLRSPAQRTVPGSVGDCSDERSGL